MLARQWLIENGGWHTSRHMGNAIGIWHLGFRTPQFRRALDIIKKEGLIDARVRHQPRPGDKYHVNEYSVIPDVDSWAT